MRAAALTRLRTEPYDVLVVGAGITGCGIARDAALRGLRVALVDQGDFASGTSSRSSRLIHGGVRYLEHGHLGLVFEASRERRTLLRIAPHLVRPLAFTWPVFDGARVSKWRVRAGLALYDGLALLRNVGRHKWQSVPRVIAAEPALRRDGMRGAARYWDAATDDARLTLANALSAAESGATVANHVRVVTLRRSAARITGAKVEDVRTGERFEVAAQVTVNAAGPWSDEISRLEAPGTYNEAPAVRGTKGVHVLVTRARIGNTGAVTLLSPIDGRVMFVLPAGPFAIIGTTDTPTTEHPATVRASADDVRYLLRTANHFFPDAALRPADVITAWAGVRPLAAGRFTGSATSASREHMITRSASGMVTVTGGKLTTYRAMASAVVDQIERARGFGHRPPTTDRLPLPGGDIPSLARTVKDAADAGVAPDVAQRLAEAHGSRWRRVWGLVGQNASLGVRAVPELPYLMAEFVYSARHEMACTLGDLLLRRTHLAFELADRGADAASRVAAAVAPVLGLSLIHI